MTQPKISEFDSHKIEEDIRLFYEEKYKQVHLAFHERLKKIDPEEKIYNMAKISCPDLNKEIHKKAENIDSEFQKLLEGEYAWEEFMIYGFDPYVEAWLDLFDSFKIDVVGRGIGNHTV